MPSNKVTELLEEVRVTIVVPRFSDQYYASVIELGPAFCWDYAGSFKGAVDRVVGLTIAILEHYGKGSKMEAFLAHHSFVLEGKLYSYPKETREKLIGDYISEITWGTRDNPFRNDPIKVVSMRLKHLRVPARERAFSAVFVTHWEHRREETTLWSPSGVKITENKQDSSS